MDEIEYCKKHDHDFNINEGCEYCYNEYLKQKEVIDSTLNIIHDYNLTESQVVYKLAIYFDKLDEELNK